MAVWIGFQGGTVSGAFPAGEYGHRLRQAGGSVACLAGSRTAVGRGDAAGLSWTTALREGIYRQLTISLELGVGGKCPHEGPSSRLGPKLRNTTKPLQPDSTTISARFTQRIEVYPVRNSWQKNNMIDNGLAICLIYRELNFRLRTRINKIKSLASVAGSCEGK